MPKSKTIKFTLIQTGSQLHLYGSAHAITIETVDAYWRVFSRIPSKGLMLFSSTRPTHPVIGKIVKAQRIVDKDNEVCIELEAVITDETLLSAATPLNFAQIARAAIFWKRPLGSSIRFEDDE